MFETPVLYIASTEYDRPLPHLDSFRVDGTRESHRATRCHIAREEFRFGGQEGIRKWIVPNLREAKAPWMIMISAVQHQERQSQLWESGIKGSIQSIRTQNSIYLYLQRQPSSWDLVPPTIFQPYATSSLCTIVEVVGILGMRWTQFDIDKGSMTANGNGHILTSSLVPGLGMLIGFSRTGTPRSNINQTRAKLFREMLFQEVQLPSEMTRVIPSADLKKLVFGVVPTILGQWWQSLDFGEDNISKTLYRYLGLTEQEQMSRHEHQDFPSTLC